MDRRESQLTTTVDSTIRRPGRYGFRFCIRRPTNANRTLERNRCATIFPAFSHSERDAAQLRVASIETGNLTFAKVRARPVGSTATTHRPFRQTASGLRRQEWETASAGKVLCRVF